jgi:hypothetical protein
MFAIYMAFGFKKFHLLHDAVAECPLGGREKSPASASYFITYACASLFALFFLLPFALKTTFYINAQDGRGVISIHHTHQGIL